MSFGMLAVVVVAVPTTVSVIMYGRGNGGIDSSGQRGGGHDCGRGIVAIVIVVLRTSVVNVVVNSWFWACWSW